MGRNESWRTGEKRGSLWAELFSHTMSGGPFFFCRGMGDLKKKKSLVEFIGAVKDCCEVACRRWSESADWSRLALALFCCWALWESVSLLRRLQGPVGWGLSDLWPYSKFPDSHCQLQQLITSSCRGTLPKEDKRWTQSALWRFTSMTRYKFSRKSCTETPQAQIYIWC